MFLFEKVWKKLWRNKGIYCVMIAELAVGSAFLGYSLCQSFSYLKSKEELKQEMSETTMSLEVSLKQEEEGDATAPFIYTDYDFIKDKVSNPEVYLCCSELVAVGEEVKEIPFIYTNLIQEQEEACIGEVVQKEFAGEYAIFDGENGYIHKDKIEYRGKEYKKAAIPKELQGKVIARNMAEDRIYENQSIFLSLKEWEKEWSLAPPQVIIRYDIEDLKLADHINQEIISILSKRHPEYLYTVSNYLGNYEQANESGMEYAKYMATLAIIGIWIMFFGCLGITKQFYAKRQKEYAICLAIGATTRDLFLEMAAENIVVIFCGIFLGNIGTWSMLRFQSEENFLITYQSETAIISILLIILLVMAINYPVYHKIRKLHPQEIIRSL